MRARGMLPCIILSFALAASCLQAQTKLPTQTQSVWDAPADLMQWISFTRGYTPPAAGVQALTENGRDFIRINWSQLSDPPGIHLPNDPDAIDMGVNLANVLDPSAYNGIQITLRHNMNGFDAIMGYYRQGNIYGDNPLLMPVFNAYAVPADAQWHTVVLKLADSAFLRPDRQLTFIGLIMGDAAWKDRELSDAAGAMAAAYTNLQAGAYLDIDRIAFIQVSDTTPNPVITDFTPKRAPVDGTIKIIGSGFAVPYGKNWVQFNDVQADVRSGDASSLVVEVGMAGKSTISVTVPGGKKATAQVPFTGLLPPSYLAKTAGDAQSGPRGTVLSPMSVQVTDGNHEPLPGINVSFHIASGGGSLSITQTQTDDNGTASTILTLPAGQRNVRVNESSEGIIDPVVFTATAQ